MQAFLKKHWPWLIPVALIVILWGSTTKTYNKAAQWLTLLAASLVVFFLLGALLLGLFELPVLVVAAMIVVLAYGAQSIYNYFTIATKPQTAQTPTQMSLQTSGGGTATDAPDNGGNSSGDGLDDLQDN